MSQPCGQVQRMPSTGAVGEALVEPQLDLWREDSWIALILLGMNERKYLRPVLLKRLLHRSISTFGSAATCDSRKLIYV